MFSTDVSSGFPQAVISSPQIGTATVQIAKNCGKRLSCKEQTY